MKNITLSLMLMISALSVAQDKQLNTPNDSYNKYAFIDAQHLYLDLVKDGHESAEIFQKLGDTYYFNNDYTNAHKWYSKLFGYDASGLSSEYYFRYIQSLKAIGDYDKANELLSSYTKIKGEDEFIKMYANQSNYLDLIELQSYRFDIKNLDINTASQDFGTSYYHEDGKVVFASAKDSASFVSRRHKWSERQFLDLFIADSNSETGELTNARKLKGKLNTKFHESNAVFTKDGSTVYYTSNNYLNRKYKKSSDDVNKLKIFKAVKVDGEWGNPEELSFNSDEWSSAHPALSRDEKRLYFASDRPGSMKALDGSLSSDIWYVNLSEGSVSEPINLKKVNTVGREFFPFISKKGDMYFSSTGHMGLGGLDVFTVSMDELSNNDAPMITNVGKPVNSSYDDFAFVINDDTQLGYLSSNRRGGQGLDDIYSFKQLKPLACQDVVAGVVTDAKSGELMPGSKVQLLDSANKVVESVVVGDDAAYSFNVDCSEKYSIRASKDGYDPGEENTQTPDHIATLDVPVTLSKSIDKKVEEVKVGDDLAEVFNIIIYFDFDEHYIRPDAAVELQKLLRYMQARPNIRVAIGSHTDSRAPDRYNEQLSDRRARATKSWLIKNGISPSRLTAKGYGENELVNECSNGVDCSEEEHQLNRRSEFIVIGM